MTDVDRAIEFCETLAKDPEFQKQYADANEFEMNDLLDMLREYKRMQESYGKYAYVCEAIPSDLYHELCDEYEEERCE
jgi:hypothetical protein